MSSLREGQNEVFEKAYDEYADAIFKYIVLRTKNRERAMDITQEVFLKTWNYLDKGEKIENMRAFLYRVAHNLFVNEIRSLATKPTDSLEVLAESGFEPSENLYLEIEKSDERESILRALDKVPDRYREAVTLRYLEELSIPEIAEILGISETNASVKIHRGLEKLRQIYER